MKVIIFGMGNLGKRFAQTLENNDSTVYFYDNNPNLWGSSYNGIDCLSFYEFQKIQPGSAKIVIACMGIEEVYVQLNRSGWNTDIYVWFEGSLCDVSVIIRKLRQRKLQELLDLAEEYGKQGRTKAQAHALSYAEILKKNPEIPKIFAIETNNICNLSCPNCPSSTSAAERGYLTDELFFKAVRYIPPLGSTCLHLFGEPLLHPYFKKYLLELVERDISPVVSSNGELMNEEIIDEMLLLLKKGSSKTTLYISLHTRQSVKAFISFREKYIQKNAKFTFYGEILSHNATDVEVWFRELGFDISEISHLRRTTSHSFAGNVLFGHHHRLMTYDALKITFKKINCYFIKNNFVNMRYDGKITACCLDSENVTQLGHINDLPYIKQRQNGYFLCNSCDPSWVNNNN